MTRTIEIIRDNQTIKCTVESDFAEALAYNRQFKNEHLDKDALGFIGLKEWKKMANDLRVMTLRYYVALRNGAKLEDDVLVDGRRTIYCWLGMIFKQIGAVNGVELRPNQNSMEVLFAEVTKDYRKDSTELGLLRTKRTNTLKLCREWEVKSANRPDGHEYIKTYQDYLADLKTIEEQIADKEAIAGECTIEKTAKTEQQFRHALERYLADIILNQGMKSVDEILAEEKALKEARKAAAKARKARKAGK